MALSSSTPIIIGVGEICYKSLAVDDAIEPANLMLRAIQRAVEDTGCLDGKLVSRIDSVSTVPTWTWPYRDLAALLADRLNIQPSHSINGSHGGNQPALLCDEAAKRIARGESELAIVAGGEALASLAACQKAGHVPVGWTEPDPAIRTIVAGDLAALGSNVGSRHQMGLPTQIYAMYEHGFRSHWSQTPEQNTDESAKLYAAFDRIACQTDYSWRFGAEPRNEDDIRRVTKKNRMICSPYPLLMNAFNTVNLAAACILTSIGVAQELGVPKEKWVYVLGGAGTSDSEHFWERANYYSSSALTQSIDTAMSASNLINHDIDCFDFYSCFPIVPKLACQHLGLDITQPQKPITLLGGLTSFGGAGNNYSMHAIIKMSRKIRNAEIRNGLVLANGGFLSYFHALCLSSQPRRDFSDYPTDKSLTQVAQNVSAPLFVDSAEGSAEIETYTVEFARNGRPNVGLIVGRYAGTGHRFLANHGDETTLDRLANLDVESVGLRGTVEKGLDGRNLFYAHVQPRM